MCRQKGHRNCSVRPKRDMLSALEYSFAPGLNGKHMNRLKLFVTLLGLLCPGTGLVGATQEKPSMIWEQQATFARSSSNPYNVNCGDKPPYKSQSARSTILSSPDGNRDAYAEAKARWVEEGSCVNTSAVFVRDKDGAFQLVFLQQPTQELVGNGIRLIDWSKYGRELLFDVIRWQDGSDAGPNNEIWIYDAKTGVFTSVPIEHIFKSFGGGCFTTVEPLGFSATGTVALEFSAKQDFDEEGKIVLPKCNKKRDTWLFDPHGNNLTQTSAEYSVPKWGKVR
jgi:hypothetical protein